MDFCGDQKAVRLAAERLGGVALFPSIDDPTPNVGVVRYVDLSGTERGIDFLELPFGLKSHKEVETRAQLVELLDAQGRSTQQLYLVLHPVHCLQSRVANVSALPGYDSPQGLRQLSAAIHSCRGFVREVFDNFGPRKALDLNEEIFLIARSAHGRNVYKRHGMDPFAAILVDDRLPTEFLVRRHPQMLKSLTESRKRS